MSASTQSKQPHKSTRQYLPMPRSTGGFVLLLSGISFALGITRDETILLLLAFMLFFCLAYSFFAVFILSLLHNKKARRLNVSIVPEKIQAEKETHIFLHSGIDEKDKGIFLQLPAILIRYKIKLASRDDKKIDHIFAKDFFVKKEAALHIMLRGVYTGEYDALMIFDVFGFFVYTFDIYCGKGARLSVSPVLRAASFSFENFSGGTERRSSRQIIRTDDLIEQRPYIAGDDPRRINWKLYGHLGDLFVREEDREPPPHARLVMLVNTEADSTLYPAHKKRGYEYTRRGAFEVDILCEEALALAAITAKNGIDVFIGSNGNSIAGGSLNEAAEALAYPCATTAHGAEDAGTALPQAHDERDIVILSLPRRCDNKERITGALDRFLAKKNTSQKTTILFLYNDEKLIGQAEASAMEYARKDGVYAKAIRV